MALKIEKAASTPSAGIVADRRLCLTADRARVVEEDSSDAAFLLATPGYLIPADEVTRLGLVVADGRVEQRASEEAAGGGEETSESTDDTPTDAAAGADTGAAEEETDAAPVSRGKRRGRGR